MWSSILTVASLVRSSNWFIVATNSVTRLDSMVSIWPRLSWAPLSTCCSRPFASFSRSNIAVVSERSMPCVSSISATVTVAEMLETHGMLRSDTTAMFERLKEANGLLQQVLSGAQDNLGQIETMLSSRVTEFVATMNQLLERTNDATVKMDDHIGQFYGVTTKTLRDLTDLSSQFDGQGRSLAQAVELVEMSNRRADEVLGARRNALEEIGTATAGRPAAAGPRPPPAARAVAAECRPHHNQAARPPPVPRGESGRRGPPERGRE